MFKNILICCLLFTGVSVSAQSKRKNIDQYFKALVKNQQFSGRVLVIEHDKIVYENWSGYADIEKRTAVTKSIRFPIASISKLFTATAILQLKENGLLRVSDPVVMHLPSFPYDGITIRHLLSHTSGLPPYNAFFDKFRKEQPGKTFTNSDFMAGVLSNKQPLIYQPGEKGNYDNINYLVLALIVEKVSGETYENFISTHILRPSGMNVTTYFPLSGQFNQDGIKNYAYPHVYLRLYDTVPVRSNTIPYVRDYWHSYGFNGFADYVSTIGDLWNFDKAIRSNKLLKQETLDEAYIPVAFNNGNSNPELFGLGWEVEQDSSSGKMVYHSGAAMGLSVNLLRNLKKNQTVIFFDNMHFNAHENAGNIMRLLNGRKVDMPRRSIAKVYGSVLLSKGAVAAREVLENLRKDSVNYYLSEDEMNSLGYDFMGNTNPYHLPEKHFFKEAVETLKTTVELFPDSWNAYDSYAEALLADGAKQEAIKMYQQSLRLNPDNGNAKKVLEKLLL